MPPSIPRAVDPRRQLPQIDQVLKRDDVADLERIYGHGPLLAELRALIGEARGLAAAGNTVAVDDLLRGLAIRLNDKLACAKAPSLIPVINATGVVIHTNLGRAPLPAEACRQVARVAGSYTNLEFDLPAGERGDREVHAERRLRQWLGVEASLAVNNCAAAVLLAVNTMAEGREVLVSRGELVEIGGSFRIPDVISKGGARLREVGTTNRTRCRDYEDALGPDTALILKVHRSNFRIVGFTEEPSLEGLVTVARAAGIPLLEDQGAGLLSVAPGPLASEPTVTRSLAAGVDAVAVSGDKLLGGPQVGLVLGRTAVVSAMRRNPLYRALRVDKMTLAALDAVLGEHQAGRGVSSVPVHRMIAMGASEIGERARRLAAGLRAARPDWKVDLVDGASAIGGGAAPSITLPTILLTVHHPRIPPDRLATLLRDGTPPVVVRVADERATLDLRTVMPEEDGLVADSLLRVDP